MGTSEALPIANEGGPARRTRATTKSPLKAQQIVNPKLQVRPPRQLPTRLPLIDAGDSGAGATVIPDSAADAPAIPRPSSPPALDDIPGEDDGQPSSPHHLPARKKRLVIPYGLVGYSQPRSDEEYYEEGEDAIPDASGIEDNDSEDRSPDNRAAMKGPAFHDPELSEDDFDGESQLFHE
jgi:hypothetical protein